jgi:hypothetical protein
MDTFSYTVGRLLAAVTRVPAVQEDEGQTLVEHGLILALIAIAAIAAMNFSAAV